MNPSEHKMSVLAQIFKLIPRNLIPKLANEHAMEKNILKVTLLRSTGILGRSAGPNIPKPDAQCRGLQRCEYALVFFDGKSADENYLWREFQSYARHPKAVMCSAGGPGAPAERSFFELESKELVLSSIVKTDVQGELKNRVYNVSAKKSSGRIKSSMKLSRVEILAPKDLSGKTLSLKNIALKSKGILSSSFMAKL